MQLLVLGRPGAGCTSLLRALSNQRDCFDEVDGETRYASMTPDEAKKHRQQIIFNAEGRPDVSGERVGLDTDH